MQSSLIVVTTTVFVLLYIHRHHYTRWCGVLAGPKSASALGSQVVLDMSVTNFELNILTNSSTPSLLIRLFIIFKQRAQC